MADYRCGRSTIALQSSASSPLVGRGRSVPGRNARINSESPSPSGTERRTTKVGDVKSSHKQSPFFVSKDSLPRGKSTPKQTSLFAARKARGEVEAEVNAMKNRIAYLKAEQERMDRSARDARAKLSSIKSRKEAVDKFLSRREKIKFAGAENCSPVAAPPCTPPQLSKDPPVPLKDSNIARDGIQCYDTSPMSIGRNNKQPPEPKITTSPPPPPPPPEMPPPPPAAVESLLLEREATMKRTATNRGRSFLRYVQKSAGIGEDHKNTQTKGTMPKISAPPPPPLEGWQGWQEHAARPESSANNPQTKAVEDQENSNSGAGVTEVTEGEKDDSSVIVVASGSGAWR